MDLINNTFQIQGLNVADICQQFGTPLYVYDGQVMINQLEKLKKAFAPTPLKIKYAAKALTNISILKLLKQHGAEVDVVSLQEAQLALHAGFSNTEIMYTPSCVLFDEIMAAVDLGLTINLDNLSALAKFGQQYGAAYPCCIRFNPHIMAGGNYKISTGHDHSKFGISVSQLPEILRIVRQYNLIINGIHIHTGSEIPQTEVYLKIAEILFGLANDFPHLKFIDIGSGLKVAYKNGDTVTDVADLGLKLRQSFNQFCLRYGKPLELWIEPGKYLVSEAGHLFVTASVVKTTPTLTFVGVNSGLNHLIRPMMYESYHQIINTSNPTGDVKTYTVVGNICETDTLGANQELNEVREGDLLVLQNAGAYGYSMASNYNSRLRPAEVLVLNGKARLIRRRDTVEDLLKNQLLISL